MEKLPEHINHHILSFLRDKETARTSVLSKAWLRAWRTRPILRFDRPLYDRLKVNDFVNYVNSTLLMYEKEKISIDELEIYGVFPYKSELINKWLELGIKMSVKKLKIDCSLVSKRFPSIIHQQNSLEDLYIGGCKFDWIMPLWDLKVSPNTSNKKLKRLSLFWICIDEGMFSKLISCCPLVESLKLDSCNFGSTTLPPSILQAKLLEDLEISGPSLLNFKLENCQKITCHKLERLSLSNVYFEEGMFDNIISSCPMLKSLKIFSGTLIHLSHAILQAKSLEDLNISGEDHRLRIYGSISCPKLKRLKLFFVEFDEGMYHNLLSSCPMIERLVIEYCDFGSTPLPPIILQAKLLQHLLVHDLYNWKLQVPQNIYCCKLKRLKLHSFDLDEGMFQTLLSSCPMVENLELTCCKFSSILDDGLKLQVPQNMSGHKFKRISLSFTRMGKGTFDGLISSCQSIESLKLYRCEGIHDFMLNNQLENLRKLEIFGSCVLKRIKISSPTLEELILGSSTDKEGLLELELDAPNIVEFRYRGRVIPRLSFNSGSRDDDIVPNIRLTVDCPFVNYLWLVTLQEFLTQFFPSNMDLYLVSFMESELKEEEIKAGLAFLKPHLRVVKLTRIFRILPVLD